MYSTQDRKIDNGTCCGGAWRVWRSDDLVDWTNVSDLGDFSWETAAERDGDSRWATDAAEKDGTYYWYVSVNGNTVSVVKSATPAGPWRDPLGAPADASPKPPLPPRPPSARSRRSR